MRSTQLRTGAVTIILGVLALDTLVAQGSAPMPTVRQVDYFNPAWSPDGRWISYESNLDGKFAIYVVAADGSGRRKLTSGVADDVQSSWSPDGQRLVFTSNRDGHNQLYTMFADGSLQRPLSPSATRDFYATYSRDGKEVLFAAQDARNRMLYYVGIVNADGSGRRILTDSTASAEGPRWTRDGTHIVFTRVPHLQRGNDEAPRDFIARRNKSSERVFLTPNGVVVTPPGGNRPTDPAALAPAEPALSADGRRMAVVRTTGGRPGIVLVDVRSGEIVGTVAGERPD
jgi:dipeptidyl aminopeptidase/acylaminoacyl peptidase